MQDATKYSLPFKHVKEYVLPERLKLNGSQTKSLRDSWWIHESPRQELYSELDGLDQVIVLAITSKHMTPAIVPNDFVFSGALAIWPSADFALFSVLSSWLHRSWAQWHGTGMRDYFRYSISEGFATFPLPARTSQLNDLGELLHKQQLAVANNQLKNLAEIYKMVNDKNENDVEISELRSTHREIDKAVIEAYKFVIPLGDYEFDFFSRSTTVQYGPPASERMTILKLLAQENIRQSNEGVIEW
jgi:hypothetical protein